MSEKIEQQINQLVKKVDRILSLLEKKGVAKKKKEKPLPPTEQEILGCKEEFEKLFSEWQAGNKIEVEKVFDAMDVEKIRRFADANNLNVTSKMSKEKVMRLIDARFRERQQLMKSHFQNLI